MGGILEGRVAIVTGSGQGVGKDVAVALAAEGAKVVTNNRKKGSSLNSFEGVSLPFNDEERAKLESVNGDAETAAAEIIKRGGEAIPVYADISKPEDCERLVKAAVSKWGKVDILMNAASANWIGAVQDMPIDKWDLNVVSKLSASFYMMHYALPYMIGQKYGRIVNFSSEAFKGLMGMSAYSAASAGVWALTKAAAQDLSELGITVNAVTPLAKTRSWYNMLTTYRLQDIEPEVIEEGSPVGMKSTPERMAPFFAYLASEEAHDISGIMFKVAADGLLSVWTESEEYNETIKDLWADGAWTMEELRERVPNELMKGVWSIKTTLPLKTHQL